MLQVSAGRGRGRGGRGGKRDESAILMDALFGDDEEEGGAKRRCV